MRGTLLAGRLGRPVGPRRRRRPPRRPRTRRCRAAAAKPLPGRHRRRRRSGCRRRSTRPRRTPRRAAAGRRTPIGVADQVEVGAQRDPRRRGCPRRPPGCRSGSGRGRRSTAAVRAGVRQKSRLPDLRERLRAAPARACRRRRRARPSSRTRPWQQPGALDHRGDGDRDQDGVVLVPGVPVGDAVGEEAPAEGGQRDEQQHRRAQGEQPGRAAAGTAPSAPCCRRPSARMRQASPTLLGRVAAPRRCRCPGSRAAATPIRTSERDHAERHRDQAPVAASRAGTPRTQGGDREAEVLLDQHAAAAPRARPRGGRRAPSPPC